MTGTVNHEATATATHLLCPICFPAPEPGDTLTALCGFAKVFTGYRDRTDFDCPRCVDIELDYGGVEGGCPNCG